MANILKLKDCEICKGAGFMIKAEAPMKGYVRPCSSCCGNYKKFTNQYGTDSGGLRVYIDRKGRVPKIIKLKHGQKVVRANNQLFIT